MNKEEKQTYLEKYHEEKEKGVPFFPDIVFKDAVISLIIFLILVALAYFVGAPLEARANPADTTYTPRPEWYFLFLFQLLKYFPGKLEVIGAFVVPVIAILILFALPFFDRSPRRHPFSRPVIVMGTLLVGASIIFLTVIAAREAPPPTEVASGDQTAALYIKNCAPCHGASINVPVGTNLHEVIAQGKHEGMPAWSADLTTNEIDALAGFILSPTGNNVFTQYCSTCHKVTDLVVDQPLDLEQSIDQGNAYKPHATLSIPDFSKVIDSQQRSLLLNFLVAPDGQRLYATNCAPCHGTTISFSGSEAQLRDIIKKGGQHQVMPAWRGQLSDADLETLAQYVANPSNGDPGAALFTKNCASCHGDQIPKVGDVTQAREAIANGGAHKTMPVWGDVLTAEQLNALVKYTLTAAQGAPLELGQALFATNCAPCHGVFGEGGPNPANPNAILPPISSSEFLKTRDDTTLRSIIAQGQPDLGMSPFGPAYGGSLADTDIDAIVAFMRAWEANPPVVQPPQIAASTATPTATPGAPGATPTATIEALVSTPTTTPAATLMTAPTFMKDVLPIFQAKCLMCHGRLGGWNGENYNNTMTTGDHKPVVIPGDVKNSLLAQKIQGAQTQGGSMPPGGKLTDSEIQLILDWIAAGALEK